jgi:hypothetical protein
MIGVEQASALKVMGVAAVPELAMNIDEYEPLVRYTVSPATAPAAALARLQGVARVGQAAAVVPAPLGDTYQSAAWAGTASSDVKSGKAEAKRTLFMVFGKTL